MSKIRINELARELEVKPSVILELLPELGVHDKKTHSSSLDDDLVLKIRFQVTGDGGEPGGAREPAAHGPEEGSSGNTAIALEAPRADLREAPARPSSMPPPLPPHVPAPDI